MLYVPDADKAMVSTVGPEIRRHQHFAPRGTNVNFVQLKGGNTIRVRTCDDAGTLVQILGYRLREGCGSKNFFLDTANPERAFLTIDSGFPLTDLEESLQKGVPFVYPYAPSRVPVLFKESDWLVLSSGQKKGYSSLLDLLVNDPAIARLYWAMTKNDGETRLALVQRNSSGTLFAVRMPRPSGTVARSSLGSSSRMCAASSAVLPSAA